MAVCRSTIERNTARRMRCGVSLEKKFSHGVEPGGRGRGEMKDPARMARQPSEHLGVFVGGIVVEHCMDQLAGWHLTLDGIQETDECAVAVALHAAADHSSVEHAEGGEQGGGAMPFVIVGHGLTASGLIGKPGWLRSRAWIWLFSSSESTTAWAGGST